MNPRLGANHAIVEKAGLHLPRWWMERLEYGHASIPAGFEGKPGLLATDGFTADLAAWLSSFGDSASSTRERFDWGASLFRSLTAPNHVIWDWRDPGPVFHVYSQLFKRGRAGRSGHAGTDSPPREGGAREAVGSRRFRFGRAL